MKPWVTPLPCALPSSTSRCGSFTGSERSSTASSRLKIAVFAPIPSASESSATPVSALLRSIERTPYAVSCRRLSNHPRTRIVWLVSRWRITEPKARRASSGSRPSAIASAMCASNSSSISRFILSPRKTFPIRDQSLIENSGEQIEEGEGEQSPAPLAVPA